MANDRRRRFIAYFEQKYKGRRADFRRDTKLTNGRISQLFDDRQPFGETAARNLALSLGLAEDFFEHDPSGPSREALDLAARIEKLTQPQREQLRALIQVVQGHEPVAVPTLDKSMPTEGMLGGIVGNLGSDQRKKKGGQHGG